ncbi:MAG TPA: hypothetical protein VJC01_00145 [Candidatus Paceibacterota bacterium]
MNYDPKTVKFEGKLLSFTGFKYRFGFGSPPVKICLKEGDKIEFIISGWGDDPYGQYYVCQGIISIIDLDNLHFIKVCHDGIESSISLSDIQEKLDDGATLKLRHLTAYY